MAYFVHGRLALVVLVHASTGHGGEEDVAAVIDVSGRGGRSGCATAVAAAGAACDGRMRGGVARGGDGGSGELAVAEEEGGWVGGLPEGGEVGLEVDVEGGIGAGAEGGLHGEIVGISCPECVDGVGWGKDRPEAHGEGSVGDVEGCELVGDGVGLGILSSDER